MTGKSSARNKEYDNNAAGPGVADSAVDGGESDCKFACLEDTKARRVVDVIAGLKWVVL